MTKFRAVLEIDADFDKLEMEEYLNAVVLDDTDNVNSAMVTQIEVVEY